MKKMLVLGMVIILALGVFVGCGQSEQVPQDQQAQSQSQEQAVDPSVPQEQDPIVDDGVVMDPSQADLIGEEKAKQIALARVEGASEADLFQFDLDYDDGRWIYEGEIHLGEWEYEFEIDGENGDVIGWEKDHIYD